MAIIANVFTDENDVKKSTLLRINKMAIDTSNSVQLDEQKFAKPALQIEKMTSSLYWANVLNVKTMRMDELENLVSNKTQRIKRRIYW